MASTNIILRFLRIYPETLGFRISFAQVHSSAHLARSSEGTKQSTDESTSFSSSSSSSDEEEEYEDNIKKKILTASLPFVLQHGWSKDAIGAGAESLGYSSISRGLFQNSGISLVHHFQESCNEELNEHLKKRRSEEPIQSDALLEIQGALETRLRMLQPYLAQWPQAMALMATPTHAPSSLKLLLNLADDICHHTGDKSVDMTWYTRRAVVAGLYVAGELSLVQDKSTDYSNTWAFLARRIEDLRNTKRCSEQAESGRKQLEEISAATITTIRNILGFGSYSR